MSETPGGSGADSAPGHDREPLGIKTLRLYGRAIRERWPMGPAVRLKVLKRLAGFVDEGYIHDDGGIPTVREVVTAARALIAADKANLDEQRLDLERFKFDLAARKAEADAAGPADDDYEIDLSGEPEPLPDAETERRPGHGEAT